ncbi:heavy-metal-associated domain-containing protein [Tepidibacter mesophilus]|uniref:heavy-metal-associated domain-containing protein n=1 Tax=Tepidibacter mesophilus TaxID=655607 RepID=UPI000C082822|nr:hypothetical protein [Tepidibacter mesophilus]
MKMKAEKFKLNNSLKDNDNLKSVAKSLTDDIHSLGGVNAVRVDPIENTVTVDYNEGQVSSNQIQQKLKDGNYLK